MDDRDDELSRLVRDRATRYRAGPALESSIRAELALQAASVRPQRPAPAGRWPGWSLMGIGFACGLAVSVALHFWIGRGATADQLEAELVDSHVRALMVSHLTDVASTDQHTVKPWFQGRVDYSPPVKDLAAEGYPLIGGRLDYIEGRAVAALIYRRHGHFINLFVWPGPPVGTRETSSRQGYNVMRWASGGMTYAAVSDLNDQELGVFATLLRQ
ncbi:MAG: anti-sigma factor [Proteobacteria bacterium]|nr:anti-sigma factor [Pseudomonadota bacterium]